MAIFRLLCVPILPIVASCTTNDLVHLEDDSERFQCSVVSISAKPFSVECMGGQAVRFSSIKRVDQLNTGHPHFGDASRFTQILVAAIQVNSSLPVFGELSIQCTISRQRNYQTCYTEPSSKIAFGNVPIQCELVKFGVAVFEPQRPRFFGCI